MILIGQRYFLLGWRTWDWSRNMNSWRLPRKFFYPSNPSWFRAFSLISEAGYNLRIDDTADGDVVIVLKPVLKDTGMDKGSQVWNILFYETPDAKHASS